MNPLQIGIVGCGVIGRRHLQLASNNPSARVVAVADVREEMARQAAAECKVDAFYPNAEKLLDDNRVEAVILALPAAGRAAIALRALAKGKHVLLEKPVATNAGEVNQLIAARGDRVVGCCSARFRVLAHAQIASALISSGALGDLRVLFSRCIHPAYERPTSPPPAWRLKKSVNGGGILMNAGCYDLDYLLGLCGWKLKPKQVLAQTWPVPPIFESHVAPGSDAETHFVAMVRCEGGTMISLERGEYTTVQHEEAWRIIGTKGSLRLQMTPVEGHRICFDHGDTGKGVVSQVIWEGQEDFMAPHAGVIEDFIAAVRDGRAPMTNLEQALVIQQISDAIYKSAESGESVEIT